jgi:hypothetical protein
MPYHHHSHSKASSTSSVSITSPAVSVAGSHSHKLTKSPHNSGIKVLPATPTSSSFPSNIRVVRTGGLTLDSNSVSEGHSAFGAVPPPSPGFPSGLVFAKRKKSPFKGPMLNVNTSSSPAGGGWRRTSDSAGSRSHSVQGRRSQEIMGIAEEEEEEEEEVEEVDDFATAGLKEGEFVDEEPKSG